MNRQYLKQGGFKYVSQPNTGRSRVIMLSTADNNGTSDKDENLKQEDDEFQVN